MGLFNTLSGALGLKDLILGVIDRLKLAPEEKAKVQLALAEQEHELKKMEAQLEARLADAAGANIRSEAASDGWLAKNSRPAFIFGAGMTIIANIWIPLVAQFTPKSVQMLTIPEPFYWLFGSGFLGYVGARSWGKRSKWVGR